MLYLYAALAEKALRLISEHTCAALAAKKNAGFKLGNPCTPMKRQHCPPAQPLERGMGPALIVGEFVITTGLRFWALTISIAIMISAATV